MIARLAWRFLTEPDPRLLARFAWQFGWQGGQSVARFRRRAAKGPAFPAFLFLSITNECNLSCQGCWVTPTQPPRRLPIETLRRIVDAARRRGSRFFGLLGGEPLLHPQALDLAAEFRDCYFQLFTNGHLLDDGVARRLRRLGNVTPLISIEGRADVSDERRGGERVLERSLAALERCRRHRLIAGVATSLCRSNVDDLATDAFVDDMVRRGALYLWYYIYRPVGPRPSPELALSEEQILRVRRFLVDARDRAPALIVDAYWDHEGRALCPAAIGISHHVGPAGDVEPCPVIQFAKDRIDGAGDPAEIIAGSDFLRTARARLAACGGGCILLERPDALLEFVRREGARDTSGRGAGFDELAALAPRPSHRQPGREVPERHALYRYMKSRWFLGMGAYG